MSADNRVELDRIRVLRSKNAGPFAWTFDIVFRSRDDYLTATRRLTPAAVASAYGAPVEDVLGISSIEPLNAFKVSLRRPLPAGHPGDPDCYGMNQEEPLARLVCQLLVARAR